MFANVCAYVYLRPALPDVASLREVQLQVPLRIYSRDGKLIQSIGEQRRIPVRYDQLPPKLIQAFLATEDDRFFRHHGVDWQGILRAAVANLKAGGIRQGASTITMQVSRDMFLTPRRDMKRKMSEIYISLLMEAEFTKEEIFSLYVNKIFLGQRAYGVGAAAEVYFGKSLDQLSLAEMATLAGIPTAPSTVNPVANAEAAKVRRAHVLGRMLELGYISQSEYDQAKSSPMESRLHGASIEVDAPYLAEMVRNDMQNKYGDAVYTAGYKVYTTIDSRLQAAGTVALRTGLIEYDIAPWLPGRQRQGRPVEDQHARPVRRPAGGVPRDRRVETRHRSSKSRPRAPKSTSRIWGWSRCPGKSWSGRGGNCPTRKSTGRRCKPPRS